MQYGLIGDRLGHSYSPLIHSKLADYTYELHPMPKEELEQFMKEKSFLGINVTIPYKSDVIPYLDEIDTAALSIGAVNTVVNKAGKLYGHNTDFGGFLYLMKKNNVNVSGQKVIVLGNGGASKAVIAALKSENASEIIIVDPITCDQENVLSYDECFAHHTDADVIVNASPVGMYPNVDKQPIDLVPFTKCKAVLDVIANPIETKLVKQARELGMVGDTGLPMLVAQAKYAAEFFLDQKIEDGKIEEICAILYENFKEK